MAKPSIVSFWCFINTGENNTRDHSIRKSPTDQVRNERSIEGAVEEQKFFWIEIEGMSEGSRIVAGSLPTYRGSPVLLYLSHSKGWEGPFKFIQFEGRTVVVQTIRGRNIFSSPCFKPFTKPDEHFLETTDIGEKDSLDNETVTNVENRNARSFASIHDMKLIGKGRKKPKDDIINNVKEFDQSKMNEIESLSKHGIFELVNVDYIIEGTHIVRSKIIETVKTVNSDVRYTSQLVPQTFGDRDEAAIATKAPTMQRFGQRLVLFIAASLENMTCHTRDFTQPYTQSTTSLQRKVFIRPPLEMCLSASKLLKVVKRNYGIPYSRLHWYLPFMEHHASKL